MEWQRNTKHVSLMGMCSQFIKVAELNTRDDISNHSSTWLEGTLLIVYCQGDLKMTFWLYMGVDLSIFCNVVICGLSIIKQSFSQWDFCIFVFLTIYKHFCDIKLWKYRLKREHAMILRKLNKHSLTKSFQTE